MPRQKKPRLTKRSDGRYRCKYRDHYFYGKTEDEAFEARDQFIRSEQHGFKRMTVQGYALPWLKRSYPDVATSTYAGLAIHLQHLIDSIGPKLISDILPSDIKGVYSTQYKGLSNSYIKAAKQLYCALFDSAVADRLIQYNPARDKSAKPHRGAKPKERILTQQERIWIETLCTDHRAYPVVMTMLYAGLRPQEAKGLNIDKDIDFDNDTITVRTTAHLDGQKYEYNSEMKTDYSKRVVPLFAPLKKVLQGRHGYLITSAHGKQVTIQTFKTAWSSYIYHMETAINGISKRWYGKTKEQKQLAEEGLLPAWVEFDIVPYTLRHAFCQMCRDADPQVDINTCKRWMGHADAKMILKVYDSVSEDRSANERKKVENWLNRGQNGGQDKKADVAPVEE